MKEFTFDRSKWQGGTYYNYDTRCACAIGQLAIAEGYEETLRKMYSPNALEKINPANDEWDTFLRSLPNIDLYDDDRSWLGAVFNASDSKREDRLVALFSKQDIAITFTGEYPS